MRSFMSSLAVLLLVLACAAPVEPVSADGARATAPDLTVGPITEMVGAGLTRTYQWPAVIAAQGYTVVITGYTQLPDFPDTLYSAKAQQDTSVTVSFPPNSEGFDMYVTVSVAARYHGSTGPATVADFIVAQ